jgi:ABC-type multidrug transport system ATPase subunit
MASLLEVGSGFHPELTGRENIFLSGTILGMSRKEIHGKIESIIDFAGVRPFIDLPVKRFSSGMYVRLGFSIAAHIEPEVLLLDEVLAVGDAAFQEKCLQRVIDLKNSGVTILFISHDLRAVERLCDRVLVMQKGHVIHDGPATEAISAYQAVRGAAAGERRVRHKRQQVSVEAVRFFNAAGEEPDHAVTGEPLRVRLEYMAHEPLPEVAFELLFIGSDAHWKTALHNRDQRMAVAAGPGFVEFFCESLVLAPDVYQIDATIERLGAEDPLDWLVGCQTLPVQAPFAVKGAFQQPFTFSVPTDAAP